MIRLYLIRHGETDWNTVRRFQGWTDIELNEKGLRQAELLGKRFENIPVDEVYASPLKRAVKTALPVAKAAGVELKTCEHFKEINFGAWEGKTRDELVEEYGELFNEFLTHPQQMTFPGNVGDGSFAAVEKRIKKGFDEILEGKDDVKIAVVSHGGIIRLMIKYLLGIEEDLYNSTWIDNTSISVVDVRKNGNILRVLNDCSHIPDNGIL